jgi:hypothetical protein
MAFPFPFYRVLWPRKSGVSGICRLELRAHKGIDNVNSNTIRTALEWWLVGLQKGSVNRKSSRATA